MREITKADIGSRNKEKRVSSGLKITKVIKLLIIRVAVKILMQVVELRINHLPKMVAHLLEPIMVKNTTMESLLQLLPKKAQA